MTAIITNNFRLQNLQYAKRDIDSSADKYYLAIGRSQDWTDDNNPPVPNIDPEDENKARLAMQSAKEITDIAYCVPRYNWTNGNTYVAYDDNDPTQNTKQFYVLNTSNFNVYICLRAGSGTSTVEPTGVNDGGSGLAADRGNTDPTAGGDGYVWKFLYNISASDADKYLTTDFMPVFRDTNVAANATLGQIWDYNIVSGGTGYSSAPTLAVEGDGSGATATCTIDGGVVDAITVTGVGSNYTYARVVVTGGSPTAAADIEAVLSPVALGREITDIAATTVGSGYTDVGSAATIVGDGSGATATLTPSSGAFLASESTTAGGYGYTSAVITTPDNYGNGDAVLVPVFSGVKGGFGYDPVVDLQANYLMFNSVLTGAEGTGDFVPGNDYRQLMIVKNPMNRSTSQPFTDSTGTAMSYVEVEDGGTYVNDDILSGASVSIRVVYHDVASAPDRVYYVQDEETGFGLLTDGETLTATGSSSGTLQVTDPGGVGGNDATNVSEIDNFSGRLLYLENRSPVSRAADQTEDIKLVVQF